MWAAHDPSAGRAVLGGRRGAAAAGASVGREGGEGVRGGRRGSGVVRVEHVVVGVGRGRRGSVAPAVRLQARLRHGQAASKSAAAGKDEINQ